ncbi:MAG: hypothetical protein G01um101425_856 [Candidatus Peregrinibacteria bacterium Gr01-1014_25]|nr:MAG: hypothetical protein G01um101425_856 [Candidatus Peregrinibacteria bacterium Gr01-1014_25]
MARIAVSIAALAALATAVLLGETAALLSPARTTASVDADAPLIAVEYDTQRRLSVTATFSRGRMLIDIAHDGTTNLVLLVPAQWRRLETHGAPLAFFTVDPPRLGLQRIVIPPRAGVRYAARQTSALALHSPSSAPLTVHLTRIDLETAKTEKDSLLLQNNRVRLW